MGFQKIGILDEDTEVDEVKKEITFDVSKQHHMHNNKDKAGIQGKLWQILLDTQSTCDGIINEALVQNIRDCR